MVAAAAAEAPTTTAGGAPAGSRQAELAQLLALDRKLVLLRSIDAWLHGAAERDGAEVAAVAARLDACLAEVGEMAPRAEAARAHQRAAQLKAHWLGARLLAMSADAAVGDAGVADQAAAAF